ncbi:MAG TPA: S-adenosylmethionine decarboxylase [Ktedonosporobacter sp.]|nr:S-adenosylmethionine decarboxylase [Ktedonosporobacter sp.]
MLVHLMLELYNCDRKILTDEPLIRRVLDEYPGRVDMEKVSPVHLYDIETSNPLDAGMSGFVVIAQSHISLHAWPEYGEVDIDICSCKEFSQEDAIAFAKEMFQTDDVEAHFVVRANRSLRPQEPDPVRYAEAMATRLAKVGVVHEEKSPVEVG